MKYLRQTLISLIIPACAVSTHAWSDSPDPVLPPDALVGEHPQREWAEQWWQWAYSFPLSSGPVADLTGDECGARQRGAVWFLAGTYEFHPVQRRCSVPAGRYIFFPIVNYVATMEGLAQDDATSCRISKDHTTRLADPALALSVELDGLPIPDPLHYRQSSTKCFDLAAGVRHGKRVLAASSGYWVMLRPLSAGHHTLRFGAVLPTIQQAVSYDLYVDANRDEL